MSFYGMYLDSVGVEYESTSFSTGEIAKILNSRLNPILGKFAENINVTRDASTEFVAEVIKSSSNFLKVSRHTELADRLSGMNQGNGMTMGFELYTNPLEIPDLAKLIYPLMFTLQSAGDFTSSRASVHFHIGYVNNMRLLKNLLRVCLMMEPVLYRLGGMGGTFRGGHNLAAYARPLLNSAVAFIGRKAVTLNTTPEELQQMMQEAESGKQKKSKAVQVINASAALEADSIEKFWAAFGVNYKGTNSKYHPCRYSGTNFFAINSHGTIEFRHFNQSMDASLIMAIAKFLRSTVELCTTLNKNESYQFDIVNSNDEISVGDSEEIIRRLVSMSYSKDIENIPSDNEISLILETIASSHFTPLPETPVKTHSRDFLLDPTVVELGKLQAVAKYLEPQNVDIHNINGKIVSIFS